MMLQMKTNIYVCQWSKESIHWRNNWTQIYKLQKSICERKKWNGVSHFFALSWMFALVPCLRMDRLNRTRHRLHLPQKEFCMIFPNKFFTFLSHPYKKGELGIERGCSLMFFLDRSLTGWNPTAATLSQWAIWVTSVVYIGHKQWLRTELAHKKHTVYPVIPRLCSIILELTQSTAFSANSQFFMWSSTHFLVMWYYSSCSFTTHLVWLVMFQLVAQLLL